MLYLLDTNVLIDAHHKFYPIDRIPEFWTWLLIYAQQQQVKIPLFSAMTLCRQRTSARCNIDDLGQPLVTMGAGSSRALFVRSPLMLWP